MEDNRILGASAEGAQVQFEGTGNILYLEPGANIAGCLISFVGDNNLVYLKASRHPYRLHLRIYSGSVFAMGADNFMNGRLNVTVSERKHVLIGNGCLISYGISITTSDVHLIYSIDSGARLNPAKSVFIGDSVWLGQNVTVLKGAEISSGAILGASTVVAGKQIPHNTAWAGNPARLHAEQVFADPASTHLYNSEMSEASMDYETFVERAGIRIPAIFEFNSDHVIPTTHIDAKLTTGVPEQKLEYLSELYETSGPNSFVWA